MHAIAALFVRNYSHETRPESYHAFEKKESMKPVYTRASVVKKTSRLRSRLASFRVSTPLKLED